MIRPLRSRLLHAWFALACAASPALAAFSDTVTVAPVTKQADGLYLYTYTVRNTGTIDISEFDVNVNDPIGLSNIKMPTDFFNFYAPGDGQIMFTASDFVIAAGTSGVFSFESASLPGQVANQVLGYDPSTGAPVSTQGFITGAATVPEPSSLLMLGLGSAGALGLLARSRARRRATA